MVILNYNICSSLSLSPCYFNMNNKNNNNNDGKMNDSCRKHSSIGNVGWSLLLVKPISHTQSLHTHEHHMKYFVEFITSNDLSIREYSFMNFISEPIWWHTKNTTNNNATMKERRRDRCTFVKTTDKDLYPAAYKCARILSQASFIAE